MSDYRFKIPFTDDELELIEDALRHYAKSAAEPRKAEALALAEKVADADEELVDGARINEALAP